MDDPGHVLGIARRSERVVAFAVLETRLEHVPSTRDRSVRRLLHRAAVLSLAALLVDVSTAVAQDDGGVVRCDDPVLRRPQEVTPADSARQVSIDAPVRVRYSAGYFGSEGPGGDPTRLITVYRCPEDGCGAGCRIGVDTGEFVPGRVQVLGDDSLFFFPDAAWEPEQGYMGIARGVDADLPFSFCTGTTPDTTPPTLERLDRVTSTPVDPRCDAPQGGYRIAAFFPPAEDFGGPPASIEYLLFQTRGAGIEEPVLRSRIRNFATSTHTMAFVLPPSEAADVICVRVAAVDGRGNLAWSDADPETDCIDPVQGNYFYPLCSASPGRTLGGSGALLALPVLGAMLVLVHRRRR
jgi:hypothetical protein